MQSQAVRARRVEVRTEAGSTGGTPRIAMWDPDGLLSGPQHGATRNSQVRPLPNIYGSSGGFECMVLELVGLSLPHAHHDRCHHAVREQY